MISQVFHFLVQHKGFGFFTSINSALVSIQLNQGVIPDGVEEVAAFTGVVIGILIGSVTLYGAIDERYTKYKNRKKERKV